MEHLWSPWRMAYLRNEEASQPAGATGCIFCDLPAAGDDAASQIVQRGPRAYVVLNKYPYNNGHMLIVPYAHVPSLEHLDEPTLTELMRLTNQTLAALRQMYNPQAFNIGANIGAAAGAGIADHVHLHVVPRWAGDTNFMTSVNGVRVIPEDLQETYRLARANWPAPPLKE
jgi:ATP adenylyltransferase